MEKINVDLGLRSYPIYIGHSLLEKVNAWLPTISGRQILIVTNETIAPLYLKHLQNALQNYQCETLILPDGEQHKTLATLNLIFDKLLAHRFDRSATLLALGGGVIGDITGFAAATYRRGIAFCQFPTTLLAQVDAAIGGKTAVNHPLGKNMIGAFHQPKCVVIDLELLKTLPKREYYAGLAEIVKYALLGDATLFDYLEKNVEKILAYDQSALQHIITVSCQMKARIVSHDETEQGERALLNLGHTFGHVIETATHYKIWLHGEAVAMGLVMAARLSFLQGWITKHDVERIELLLKQYHLPTERPAEIGGENFYNLMTYDKKVLDHQLRLILLKSIGQAVISKDYSADNLRLILGIKPGVHHEHCEHKQK